MDEKELLERLGVDDDFGQIDPETQEEQNKISGRLNNSDFEDLINEFEQELGDDLITFVGKKINVYKFRKISGITAFTTQGQQGLAYNPNNAGQYIHIYSSNEPVTIVWEGSTKIETINNQELEKTLQVGKYETMWFNNNDISSDLEDADIDIFNINYKTQTAKRTIQLASKEWEIELHDQMNYLYLVLDPAVKFPQLLEIKHYSNKYHHTDNKKFLYSIATFESVNFKFAQSGRNILETIQFSAAGEEYAYPKEIINEDGEVEVILDEEKLDYINIKGVKTIQIEFNNAVNFSSIRFLGRKKNVLKENVSNKLKKFKVDTPSFLFTKELLPPIINNFTYNTPNSTNIFTNLTGLSKKSVWNSYKEHWKDASSGGGYNILEQKEVRAGLQFDDGVQNDTDPAHLWEDDFKVKMSSWFSDLETKSSLQTISYCKDVINGSDYNKTFADWNNINGIYNSNTEALNYSYEEITRWSLKDVLGVLGGVVETLMGGLDYGWVKTKLIKTMFKRFNFTQPWITLNDFKAIYGNNYDLQKKPQPLDFFDDNRSKNMLPVNTNIYCAYRFGLTNYFKDTENVIQGNELGKGGNGVWKTLYLGQTTFEDGTTIFNNNEPLKIDLAGFTSHTSLDSEEFIIDYIDFKVLGATDYKISCYDVDGNEIYGYYGKTTAKIKEDLRLWTNRMKLNYYDKYNTIGQIDYPKPIEPNNPDDYIQENVSIDVNEKIYKNWDASPFTFEMRWEDGFNDQVWLKVNKYFVFRSFRLRFLSKQANVYDAEIQKNNFSDKLLKKFSKRAFDNPHKLKFIWRFKDDYVFLDSNNYAGRGEDLTLSNELQVSWHDYLPQFIIERNVQRFFFFQDQQIKDNINNFWIKQSGDRTLQTWTRTIDDRKLINVKKIKIVFSNNDEWEIDTKFLTTGQQQTFEKMFWKKKIKETPFTGFTGKRHQIKGFNSKFGFGSGTRAFSAFDTSTLNGNIKLQLMITKNSENSFTFAFTPIITSHAFNMKPSPSEITGTRLQEYIQNNFEGHRELNMTDQDLPTLDINELKRLDFFPDFGIDEDDWWNKTSIHSLGDWSHQGQTIKKIIFENDIIVPYTNIKEL